MTRGTLPPQAYTREDLKQAYLWLREQPESVRQMVVHSPDALVGLYLRAKRSGESSLETASPVGHQQFLTQLKTIASEQLPQFAEGKARGIEASEVRSKDSGTTRGGSVWSAEAVASFKPQPVSTPVRPASLPTPPAAPLIQDNQPERTEPPLAAFPPTWTTDDQAKSGFWFESDTRTASAIQQVKVRLNIHSDTEALRVLVTLGAEKLLTSLP